MGASGRDGSTKQYVMYFGCIKTDRLGGVGCGRELTSINLWGHWAGLLLG